MPPQTPQSPQSILDPLAVSSDVKADAWDAYHGAKSPADFKTAFDKLDIPDSAKSKLWDLKFPKQATPQVAKTQSGGPIQAPLADTTIPGRDQLGGSLFPLTNVDTSKLAIGSNPNLSNYNRVLDTRSDTSIQLQKNKDIREAQLSSGIGARSADEWNQIAQQEGERANRLSAMGLDPSEALSRQKSAYWQATMEGSGKAIASMFFGGEAVAPLAETAVGKSLITGTVALGTIDAAKNIYQNRAMQTPEQVGKVLGGASDLAFSGAMAASLFHPSVANEFGLSNNAADNAAGKNAGDVSGLTRDEITQAMKMGYTPNDLAGAHVDAEHIGKVREAIRNGLSGEEFRTQTGSPAPPEQGPGSAPKTSNWENIKQSFKDTLQARATSTSEGGFVDFGGRDPKPTKSNVPESGRTPAEQAQVEAQSDKDQLEETARAIVARNEAKIEKQKAQLQTIGPAAERIAAAGLIQERAPNLDMNDEIHSFNLAVPGFEGYSFTWNPNKEPNLSVQDLRERAADKLDAFAKTPPSAIALPNPKSYEDLTNYAKVLRTPLAAKADEGVPPDTAEAGKLQARKAELEQALERRPPEDAFLPFNIQGNIRNAAAQAVKLDVRQRKEGLTDDVANARYRFEKFGDRYEINKYVSDSIRKTKTSDLVDLVAQHEQAARAYNAQGIAGFQLSIQHNLGEKLAAALKELKATGGPMRRVQMDSGMPTDGRKLDMAELAHYQGLKPEDRLGGRWARHLLRNLVGQELEHPLDNIIPHEKPPYASDSEWKDAMSWMHDQRGQLEQEARKRFEELKAHPTSESHMDAFVQSLADYNDMSNRYGSAPITDMLTGKPKNADAMLGPQGELQFPEALPQWNLKRAQLFLRNKVNKMPSLAELVTHALNLQARAKEHTRIAEAYNKEHKARVEALKQQIGGLSLGGRVKLAKGLASKIEDPQVAKFDGLSVMKQAKRFGLDAYKTDDTHTVFTGWMSPDGQYAVENGALTHPDVAKLLFPAEEARGSAMKSMMDYGWMRVNFYNSYHSYEVSFLDDTMKNALELDMIRKRMHGQDLMIDVRRPGGTKTLDINAGWDNFPDALRNAIKDTPGFSEDEYLANRIERTIPRGSITSGVAGAAAIAIMAHIGGPILGGHGPHIGMSMAAMFPAALMTNMFRPLRNLVGRAIGRLPGGWQRFLYGTPQRPSNLDTRLDEIQEAQWKSTHIPDVTWADRIAHLGGNYLKAFHDSYIFLRGDVSPVTRAVMALDERGQVFRNLHDDTPWHIVRDAMGDIFGGQEVNTLDYMKIKSDAQAGGNMLKLNDHLNLVAYERAFEVVNERLNEYQNEVRTLQQQITPNIPVARKVHIEDQIDGLQSEIRRLQQRIASNKIVPKGMSQADIQQLKSRQIMQEGPNYAVLQALANRVFRINRMCLDMTHDAGIISDEAYQKYTSRGDEYIPMHRIMQDLADWTKLRADGVSRQLYLKQQNIIDQLVGSERINEDPLKAIAALNREMIAEVHRNIVGLKMLHFTLSHPSLYDLFTPVRPGARAQAGNMVIGYYHSGKPQHYEVPAWFGMALTVNPKAAELGLGALARWSMNIQRAVLTHGNILFSTRNALRHFEDMALMSEGGVSLNPLKMIPDAIGLIRDWMQNFQSALTKDPTWRANAQLGYLFSTASRMINPERYTTLEQAGWKEKIAKGHIIEFIKDINGAVEDANKMTTYQRMIAKGFSPMSARHEAKDFGGAPDYSIKGDYAGFLGPIFMFFNARMRYLSRFAKRLVENPIRMGAILFATTTLAMALGEWNLQQVDSQGNQMLRKVSPMERESNFVILTPLKYQSSTGAEMPVKILIPKPSFYRYLGNAIEGSILKMLGQEQRSGAQLASDSLTALLPAGGQVNMDNPVGSAAGTLANTVNPVFKIPVEEIANQTSEFGPIVPDSQRKLASSEQYAPNTPLTFRQMGKGGLQGAKAGAVEGGIEGEYIGGHTGALVGAGLGAGAGSLGISPRRLEHVTKGTMGIAGDIATNVSDSILGGSSQKTVLSPEGSERLDKQPVLGAFYRMMTGSTSDAMLTQLNEKFYREADRATTAYQTYNEMVRNGKQSDADVWYKLHERDIERGEKVHSFTEALNRITQVQKMLMYNPKMPSMITPNQPLSDAERRDQLAKLYILKIKLLREGIDYLENTRSTGGVVVGPGTGQGNASR